MEPLPRGANFVRAKFLWEIGLDVAGDQTIPYGGNRDMAIVVGSGGGRSFKPSLTLATGSAIMAHDVIAGKVQCSFVNPSALLTQAYRGLGVFDRPLPVRVVCSYPSWDRFAMVAHARTGLKTIADIKAKQYPLKMSVREDPTHSTFVLIDQIFGHYGFSLKDVVSWGGELVTTGAPQSAKRLDALRAGTVDAVFDEAMRVWFDVALAGGYQPLDFSAGAFDELESFGWRRAMIRSDDRNFRNLKRDYECIDFSGWPLYCAESLDEKVVYDICEAVVAREAEMPWEDPDYRGIGQVFAESPETPIDVPLHPGVERFVRDRKLKF